MALLNETVYREKLQKLNTSQQSIEQTAAWALFHRRDARRVAEVWEDFFSKADQAKRLAMVYLANDIVQNGCASSRSRHNWAAAARGRGGKAEAVLAPSSPIPLLSCLPLACQWPR